MELLIGFLVFGLLCMILSALFGPFIEDVRRNRGSERRKREWDEFMASKHQRSRPRS